MKKIYTFAIMMLTLLSCFVFTACGNKYKKMSLDFYLEGKVVSSVNFLLEEDNNFQDEMTIGLKFSKIKEKNIKEVVFEFDNTIGTLTNQHREGKTVYITLTVTSPVENKDLYLKAIHTASGKTKSLRIDIDQKANDVEMLEDTYIISIPSTGANVHEIDSNSIVKLLPAGSTDKVLFKSATAINKNHIKAVYEGEFIKGFEVSSSLREKVEISGLYPVTILNEENSENKYSNKTFKIVFIPTLSTDNLSITSDEKHLKGGYLYDPIHLIANDVNKATDDYNYNNFYVQLNYKNSESVENVFIKGYQYSEYYAIDLVGTDNIIMNFNEDNTKVFIQAKNMNEDIKKVKIILRPNGCVGDVQPVELMINIKADVKPTDIELKQGNKTIVDNSVNIYDVYTGDLVSQMLSFSPEVANSLSDLQQMRIQIPAAYLNTYVSEEKGVNKVYTDDTFTTLYEGAIVNERANWKLLSIYKNNSYKALKFYYDTDNGFVSETITKYDKLFIKYINNNEIIDPLQDKLSMKVFNYYSGNHIYLENIDCREEIISFNSKLGIETASYEVSTVSYRADGSLGYEIKADRPESVYIDRNESVVEHGTLGTPGYKTTNKYALKIKDVFGVNDKISSTEFNVDIVANDGQSNCIEIASTLLNESEYKYDESRMEDAENFIFFKLDDADIGKYTLKITHNSGYSISLSVYVYDSTVKISSKLSISGKYINNKEEDDYIYGEEYGDYIVESGEKITIEVDHLVPNWYVDQNNGYEYTAEIKNVSGVNQASYFKLSYKGKVAELTCLKGTYIGGIKTITLKATVKYKTAGNNLQLTNVEPISQEITIFVYEKIEEKDFEINVSEVDVYSHDLLGVHDKEDSLLGIDISLPNKSELWNYTQKLSQNADEHKIGINGDKDVVWYVNNGSLISTDSQYDRDISLQFFGTSNDVPYDVVVYAKIQQFDTTFEHLSCLVHVRKPIITTSLNVEFEKGENKKVEIKDNTLNIRDGVAYRMYVDNIANSSMITNKNTFAVVVNGNGEVVSDIVELTQISPREWEIVLMDDATLRNDLRLLVFAKDAMSKNINNYTYDLLGEKIQDYLLTGHKGAYKEYKLSLSDGTISNRYWIESADDFWEIKDNENLQDKHFELRNNINLKNTTYTAGVIEDFTGSISTYKLVELTKTLYDAGTFYEIKDNKFVLSTSPYAENIDYYENRYYSIYGLELGNDNKNLFGKLSANAEISSVQFVVKFTYYYTLQSNDSLGIVGENSGTLNNVTASVSGYAKLEAPSGNAPEASFAPLVGTNKGYINIIDESLVGVTGEVKLEGDAIVRFGAVAGTNNGTINGVIADDNIEDGEGIVFVMAFGDQGAISNMIVNATLNHDKSTIGGVVGYNKGKINDTFVTGKIVAPNTNNVGGVVGTNETTVKTATIKFDKSSYNGLILSATKNDYDLKNIKSNVVIQAKDNVGGIVGQDSGGNYYYCRYQIAADVSTNGIKANNNVGGIAGSSIYGKFIYCSVYGYRWDYTDIRNTFNDKEADIYGENNVGGIVGFASVNYTGTTDKDVISVTAIRQSSVNAFVGSKDIAGGLVGKVDSSSSNLPTDAVYFMGKIVAVEAHPWFESNTEYVQNNIMYINYYYSYIDSLNVIKNQLVDLPSGDEWKTSSSINDSKPYIHIPDGDEPIFDLAPNSVIATAKDSAGRVTKVNETLIHIDFYQTKLSVLDTNYQNEQNVIDLNFNIYNFSDLFSFACTPSGKYRFKVGSSNEQVAEILNNGQLKIKGVGTTEITFTSVLNSAATCKVKIEVNYPINNNYIISNSASNRLQCSTEHIATGQAKQYYVHEFNDEFKYRTNTDLGYIVNITGSNVADYIKVSNMEYSNNMIVAPGRKLSFELFNSVETEFSVSVTPFVLIGDKNIDDITNRLLYTSSLNFTLSTKQGISDIKLNYSKVVLYPNDEIVITATFTTDKELLENDVMELASIEMDRATDKYLTISYIESSLTEFNKQSDKATGTQTAKYKVSVADIAKYLTGQADVKIKIAANGVDAIANFKLLAQRIDNIDIKNYTTSRLSGGETPDNIADDIYEVEALSRILRPNYSGLLVLDVVPSNGQFDYLEITDVTGSEEIVFSQVDCNLGEQIEGYPISGESLGETVIDKGIRLVGNSTRYYVMTRISADYTSRIHTIKVTAKLSDGTELASTYYYIDVKMMPSVTMEYYDPNGILTAKSTDNDNCAQDLFENKLYLANGVNSVDFYITTKNSDGNVDISLMFEGYTKDANEYFEMVKGQRNHYELNFKKYDSKLIGKTLVITATTRATMDNGTVEYESTTFKFIITEFVIHNISVNNSTRLDDGYSYEIYGDYNIPIDLRFYLDKTDISFYNNGNPFSQKYVYKSPDYNKNIDNGTIVDQIYQILRELNTKPDSYIKLNNNSSWIEYTGGKYIATGNIKVKITRDDTLDTTTLNVEKDDVVAQTNILLNFGYDYSVKEVKASDDNVNFARTYKLNFTDRTSLFNMTAINNEEDFLNISSSDSGYYILTRDLELGKIGTSTYEKYGSYSPLDVDIAMFDGNGYTIKIYSFAEFGEETIQAGLFKQIRENMIVMNLNVEYISQNDGSGHWTLGNVNSKAIKYADICNLGDEKKIDYTSVQFGGISPINNGIVTNCKVSGRIALHASTLENSANTTKEIAFDIGGLVGTNSGYITHSVSELQIYALANIGGLVYENTSTGKIASSYFDAQANKGLIYAYPDINSDATNAIETRVSGFVVDNAGEISMSYSSIGLNKTIGNIGAMTVKDSSSGFVYSNSGEISDCYVTQLKLGQSNNTFYGFVYKNSGDIKTSYTYINEGGWSDKVRLFAPSGTAGLVDCIEFISTNVGYTIKSSGLHSVTIRDGGGNVQYDKMNVYTKYNFNFGDNENSIWTIEDNAMPRLVATLETATGYRLVENITETKVDKTGKEYEETTTKVYDNGYGTKQNPYIIYDLATWDAYMRVSQNDSSGEIRSYYRIVADIDFSSITKNLPTTELVFAGNIQGNNMSISGFTIYSEQNLLSIGLFKEIKYSNAREISPAIRNINFEASSVLAVKTEVVGVLAGYIENYHLYNISVACDEVVLGGNVVGGLAGVIAGDFDIEDVSSSVSVNAAKHTVGGLYDVYISDTNVGKGYRYYNVNKVNFAGSVAGIVDAFDESIIFDCKTRYIDADYYKSIKKVSVEGSIIAIGENVGGMFGLLTERVKLVDAQINISGGKITATRNTGMAVAENRGVMLNVTCSTEDEDLFKDSNYIVGGAVGVNFGGYVGNVQVKVDIIKMSSNNTVGGVVGRNIGGTVEDSKYIGKLFAYIMGGVIGVDNKIETYKNSGTISADSVNISFNKYIDNGNMISKVQYYQGANEIQGYSNCAISIETLNYWIENANRIVRYSIDKDGNDVPRSVRCLGMFIGRASSDRNDTVVNIGDFVVFNNGTSTKTLQLGTIKKDEKHYLTKLEKFKMHGIEFTFDSGSIEYIPLNITGNNVYTFLISGSEIDNFDAWENDFDKTKRILLFNESIIVEEETEAGITINPSVPEEPVGEPESDDDPDSPADPPQNVQPEITPIVSTSLFEEKYYNIRNSAKDANNIITEDITINSREELIKWIDFVSYYHLSDDRYIKLGEDFVLYHGTSISQMVSECFHAKSAANFCYSSMYKYNSKTLVVSSLSIKCTYDYVDKLCCSDHKQALSVSSVQSRTLPVDAYTNNVSNVSTGDQLAYIFEQNATNNTKFKPDESTITGSAKDVYIAARTILNTIILDSDGQLEKARKIYEWMVTNVIYDTTCMKVKYGHEVWEKNCVYFAEGALLNGTAVCDGFSKAYVILCGMEGISCIQVDGFPSGGGSGHAWNEIKINGSWYGVDIGPNDGFNEKFLFGYNNYYSGASHPTTDNNSWLKSNTSASAYNVFGIYTINHPTEGNIDLVIDSVNETEQLKILIEAAINESLGLTFVYIQFRDNSSNITNINTANNFVNSALLGLGFSLKDITKTLGNGTQEVYVLELQKVA